MKKGDILIRTCDGKPWVIVDPENGKILPAPEGRDTLSGPHYVEQKGNVFVGLSGETYEMRKPMKPEVGQVCTFCIGSDRYVGHVTSVSKTGKSFSFKLDRGEEKTAKLSRSRGMKGTFRVNKRYIVLLGISDPYLDPSF